jgi:hypothetical protein
MVWLVLALARLRASQGTRTAQRGNYFAAAPLDAPQTRIEPTGFARMAGHWHGHRFDLQAVPDSLTFRKLPTLWVMATLTEPQPIAAEYHLMARATGQETFSRAGQMPFHLPLPQGMPPDSVLRADSIEPPGPKVLAMIAELFVDPSVKEVVLSPKALRLVILGDEADRTRYLLYRDVELGQSPLTEAAATSLFTRLIALSKVLQDA